jgi:outer membrane protein/adhesin transport system outer membrane protein
MFQPSPVFTKPLRLLACAVGLAGLLCGSPAGAETLADALVKAYQTNPQLLASRAELRATDELVPQALSGWRPTAIVNGNLGEAWANPTGSGSVGGSNDFQPRGASLDLVQPLYRGGRTTAETRQAENLVLAQRSLLTDVEQNVLLAAVTAYVDVVRDAATLDLNINQEKVLRRDFEQTQARFEVGELTKTDVAQSESRLADATANRIVAEGRLQVSRARYAAVIGDQPGTLQTPPTPSELPAAEAEAVAGSEDAPRVVAAEYNERAAADGIDVAFSDLLPNLDLVGSAQTSDESSAPNSGEDSASIMLQLTVPLYQAGAPEANIRRSKQIASQRRQDVVTERRTAVANAINAWQTLVTARAAIVAIETSVAANKIALEGVRLEEQVGARTILDVLDAEQEYLASQVNLVSAHREEVVAAYTVLAAVGRLTARDLALPVPYYDVEAYYQAVRDKFWGTGTPAVE